MENLDTSLEPIVPLTDKQLSRICKLVRQHFNCCSNFSVAEVPADLGRSNIEITMHDRHGNLVDSHSLENLVGELQKEGFIAPSIYHSPFQTLKRVMWIGFVGGELVFWVAR